MLVQQHYMPMPTTVGVVEVPLGQTRLQIARLIAMMIMSGQDCVVDELATLGTLSVLMVIKFSYLQVQAAEPDFSSLFYWPIYIYIYITAEQYFSLVWFN